MEWNDWRGISVCLTLAWRVPSEDNMRWQRVELEVEEEGGAGGRGGASVGGVWCRRKRNENEWARRSCKRNGRHPHNPLLLKLGRAIRVAPIASAAPTLLLLLLLLHPLLHPLLRPPQRVFINTRNDCPFHSIPIGGFLPLSLEFQYHLSSI